MNDVVAAPQMVGPVAAGRARVRLRRLGVGTLPFIFVLLGLNVFESGAAALVSYHAFALAVPWLHGRWVRREVWGATARRLGYRVPEGGRTAAWAAGATVFMSAGVLVGAAIGTWADPDGVCAILKRGLATMGVMTTGKFLCLAAYNLAANGAIEETFWRGFFLPWLDEVFPPGVSTACNAALFALLHLPAVVMLFPASQVAPGMAVLVGAGAIWARLTRRAGSLWPAVISHCLGANLTMLVLGYFIVTGPAPN